MGKFRAMAKVAAAANRRDHPAMLGNSGRRHGRIVPYDDDDEPRGENREGAGMGEDEHHDYDNEMMVDHGPPMTPGDVMGDDDEKHVPMRLLPLAKTGSPRATRPDDGLEKPITVKPPSPKSGGMNAACRSSRGFSASLLEHAQKSQSKLLIGKLPSLDNTPPPVPGSRENLEGRDVTPCGSDAGGVTPPPGAGGDKGKGGKTTPGLSPNTPATGRARRHSKYCDQEAEDLIAEGASEQELLYFYAERGDLENVTKMCSKGAKLEVPDKEGRTALEFAAFSGKRDLVRYIFLRTHIRRREKVSRQELLNLVKLGIRKGYRVLVEIVFDAYNLPVDIKIDMSQGNTALIYAAKEGQVALVEMFCRRGADLEICDVNNMTALHWAGERAHLETAKALIRSKAPLHIKNAIYQRPIAVLGKVMNHKMFNQVMLDAYGTMVALGFEYLICSSFPRKMEMVKSDIILFTKDVLTKDASEEQEGTEGAGHDEDDEDDNRYFKAFDDDGPAEYVVKSYEMARRVGENLWILASKKTGQPVGENPEVLHSLRFDVSYGFDDVFATINSSKKMFQKALKEENAGMTDNWFLSTFLTRSEGLRIMQVYSRAFDIVGLLSLLFIYIISLLIGIFTCIAMFFYSAFLALTIMARNTIANFLDIRAWTVWVRSLARKAQSSLLPRKSSMKRLKSYMKKSKKKLLIDTKGGAGSGKVDAEEEGSDEEEEDEMDMFERGEADVPTSTCSFVVWGSLMHGILKGLWDSMRGKEKERHSHVAVKKVDIINAVKAYPDGLLSVLVEYDVESTIFGTDGVRAVVDWKWRTYARGILKTELVIHVVILILIIKFSQILHNPRSGFYHDSRLPTRAESPTGLDAHVVSYYSDPPSRLTVNALNFSLCLLLGRVLFYEVVNFVNAGTFRQWSSTVWSWVDVGTVLFYALTIFIMDINWTSRAAACFTLLCWGKLFYYLKGFGPTSSLVQMVVATANGVKWFLLLLGIIFMGFGSALYILFRQKSVTTVESGDVFSFIDFRADYINLLAVLMGNIQSSDFINVDESAMGVGMITIYTILVVIIMLNLLISIVDKVYDDTMRHQQTEFVKAKAQIINEMEQTYFIPSADRSCFPDKLYFIRNVMHETKDSHTLDAAKLITKESSLGSRDGPSGAGGSASSLVAPGTNTSGNNLTAGNDKGQHAAIRFLEAASEWRDHQQGSCFNLLQDSGEGGPIKRDPVEAKLDQILRMLSDMQMR